jgi:UDP-N-acetylglucosamine 2-epimerase (non-hydrolysing)/GDP/UDP-N,N'-diacetylbacillosamine 2-epimerase (hydrolysing)
MSRRRICVVTGSRAEYGLLYWLMRALADDPDIEFRLAVTGMHLAPEFGLTWRTIEADGFAIDETVEMLLSGDTPVAVAKSIGLGVIGFADAFARLRPDIVVLLGDRYETFAAAQAALTAAIPIAHIHGGEVTEGAIDEAMRHAISKMAHLHFTAAEPYRRRVIQLGEDPARVFTVGAPGLDNVLRIEPLGRPDLACALDFDLGEAPLFLVTYHPATASGEDPGRPMRALFDALDGFPESRILITKANADAGGRVINRMIDGYAAARPGSVKAAASLGTRRYVGALRAAAVVVGNSSSGIIEAPALGRPTVNLGDRQAGRLRAASIIDCREEPGAIKAAIATALTPAFQAQAAQAEPPYGRGGATEAIHRVLRTIPLDGLARKRFHDLAPEAVGA